VSSRRSQIYAENAVRRIPKKAKAATLAFLFLVSQPKDDQGHPRTMLILLAAGAAFNDSLFLIDESVTWQNMWQHVGSSCADIGYQ
jgi:hypothetical protein